MEPLLGHFQFDLYGHTAYIYSLMVLFILFVIARRIVNSPFGLSLRSVKGQSGCALRRSASTSTAASLRSTPSRPDTRHRRARC